MKLSVVLITYNQERFIAQALASVVSQRLNVDHEIIVADDSSTDDTPKIVMDFYRRYPATIIPIMRDKNLGMMLNFRETLKLCKGQYVAMLDGDDYWTCEVKLQKQLNFLDEHPDHSVCCHRAQFVDETGRNQSQLFPRRAAGTYTITDILDENWIVTSSVMYRWGTVGLLPDWFLALRLGDWPLHILIARSGKIHLMDDVMSVYRIHEGGAWSSMAEGDRLREIARMLAAVSSNLDSRYEKAMRRALAGMFFRQASLARAEKNPKEVRRWIMECLGHGGWWLPGHRRTVASLVLYSLLG